MHLNLNSAVASTPSRYCTESSSYFCHFLLHRMGDTASAKNDKNNSNLQHISGSRYDSTAEFRFKASGNELATVLGIEKIVTK